MVAKFSFNMARKMHSQATMRSLIFCFTHKKAERRPLDYAFPLKRLPVAFRGD